MTTEGKRLMELLRQSPAMDTMTLRIGRNAKEHLPSNEVATDADAKERIGDYAQHWKIERFHYVLKSGCKIEEKQSRSFDGLAVLTLLYSVIALQMMSLLYLRRLDGDLPTSLFLDEAESKVLYCAARKKRAFPGLYTLRDVVCYLARLGGRHGVPSDGAPGLKSLWLGLAKLYTLLTYRDFLV